MEVTVIDTQLFLREIRMMVQDAVHKEVRIAVKEATLKEWYSRRELAELLDCSAGSIDRMAREGIFIRDTIKGLGPRYNREKNLEAIKERLKDKNFETKLRKVK